MIDTISPDMPLRTIDTPQNVDRLQRFFHIEKQLMLIGAAKLPELAAWTLKHQVGHHIYQDMQHADALRRRRQELPGGRRDADAADADILAVIDACLHFPGDVVFCSAVYLGFKQLLVAAYREHLEQTTSVSDLPGRSVIERNASELQCQIAWIAGALAMMPATAEQRKQASTAIEHVRDWIEAAGGMLGAGQRRADRLPAPEPYRMVETPKRDARQTVTFEFILPPVVEGVHRDVIDQFTAFFREMAAAETVAGVLWDAPRDLPWEFYADTARHFWDEIRHSQAGQQRMEQFGYDIWTVPVQTGNYIVRSRMPVLERYALLTQVQEKSAFAYKHKTERISRQAGDTVSADMIAYDIADETLHVKLGVKWTPRMQECLSDHRPFDQLIADSVAMWDRLMNQMRAEVRAGDGGAGGY